MVAHLPWQNKGHLEGLYLAPLQREVDQNLFPYWSRRGFILWIDIKDPRASLRRKLARLLEKYPMVGKEVEVVITGIGFAKRRFARDYPHLGVQPDADEVTSENLYSGGFTWFALKWGKYFKWNGQGNMPSIEVEKLKSLVQTIHRHQKKVRFYGSPDTHEYWKMLKQAEVDLIDTDLPAQLADFWKSSSFSP